LFDGRNQNQKKPQFAAVFVQLEKKIDLLMQHHTNQIKINEQVAQQMIFWVENIKHLVNALPAAQTHPLLCGNGKA